jgi:thiol-disulfide isomerase/thioredoxin
LALINAARLFVVAIFGLWLTSGSTLSAAGRPPVSSFSLTSLSGDTVTLESYRDTVVLVNFWASWCPPCVYELPSMQALKTSLAGQPFEILALNMGEHRKQVDNFRRNFKSELEFPILLNADRNMTKDWRVRALPTSMLIDKKGRLVQTLVGPRDWSSDNIKTLILPLLDE